MKVRVSYHLRQISPIISITIPTKTATAIIMAIDIPCELFTAPQIVSPLPPSPPIKKFNRKRKHQKLVQK